MKIIFGIGAIIIGFIIVAHAFNAMADAIATPPPAVSAALR